MRYFSLAKFFFEKCRHKAYLGLVQNNLAQLYRSERRFESAHEAADRAIKLYKQVRDKTREASTIDTKAQIYLAERRLPEALASANLSVAKLRKSEIAGYLAESLVTRSKILLYSDNLRDALLNLIEAVNITRVQNSEDAAGMLVEEFAAAIREKERPSAEPLSVEKDDLELILPASLANYTEYKGIWINSSHLEKIGLVSGSLAIIVPGKVERGDLIAICELENESITCGFYDAEFGIVCLERGDDEPLLFNDGDIRILGKIIGVTNGRDAEGKMNVKSLSY